MTENKLIVYEEQVKSLIHKIRGVKVMFDFDLAQLYGVETRVLKQSVRRNIHRFPSDFMFELSKEESENWRSQIVISNPNAKMGFRRKPMVFTELGVAMLASVLNSKRAIEANIAIMRAFVQMRQISFKYEEIMATLEDIQEKIDLHDDKIDILELFIKKHMLEDIDKGNKH